MPFLFVPILSVFVPFFPARSNNHQCPKKHISSPSLAGHLKFNQTKQLLYPKLRKNIHQHLPWGHANISPHLHQTFHHIFTKHFRYLKFSYPPPPPPKKKKTPQKRFSQWGNPSILGTKKIWDLIPNSWHFQWRPSIWLTFRSCNLTWLCCQTSARPSDMPENTNDGCK